MTTSSEKLPLPAGTVLSGKWNGKSYRLERLLGIGSNGQVYLASGGRATYALKIGMETVELQAEANALISLDRRERGRPPFLLDVDDALFGGKEYSFYVMQYVPGVSVRAYLKQQGEQWFGVIGYRLLKRLAELHEAGWVFGDLKNDNILVNGYGKVALVDFGGMTALGRGVRQFTEIYDRGYWGAGSRTADPAYDWFSVAVLWIHVLDGKRLMQLTRTLLPQNRHPGELMALVRANPALRAIEPWFERALAGRFRDTEEARDAWRDLLHDAQRKKSDGRAERVPGWMKGLFALSALSASAAAFWLFK